MNFLRRLGFLRRNLGYKILSVAISVLLYLVVLSVKRPVTTKDDFIQPEIVNIPPGMVVKGDSPPLPVKITGLATAVEDYRLRKVKATVDLADAKSGQNTVNVVYRTENLDVEVSGPPRTTVTLEKKAERDFKVSVAHDPTTPNGYVYEDPQVTPPHVTVTGRASDVNRVARVVAIVSTDGSRTFSGDVDLVAQNTNYDAIDTVVIDPPRVHVNLGLKLAPQTRTVFLAAAFQGEVAPGYYLKRCTLDPPNVVISGDRPLVEQQSEISVPVDVSGLRESVVRQVSIASRLPKGLTSETTTVSVRLEAAPLPTGGAVTVKPGVGGSTPTPVPSANPTPAPKESP